MFALNIPQLAIISENGLWYHPIVSRLERYTLQ